MEDNLHPVIALLKARAETSPEEFDPDTPEYRRWDRMVAMVLPWLTPTEKLALRGVFLDTAHRWALDELMNGPSRRATEKAKEDASQQMRLRALQQYALQQQAQQLQPHDFLGDIRLLTNF